MSRLFAPGTLTSTTKIVVLGTAAAVSVGAVALSYCIYNKNRDKKLLFNNKSALPSSSSSTSRKKRTSSGNGENRVTFSEKDEIIGEGDVVFTSSQSPSPVPIVVPVETEAVASSSSSSLSHPSSTSVDNNDSGFPLSPSLPIVEGTKSSTGIPLPLNTVYNVEQPNNSSSKEEAIAQAPSSFSASEMEITESEPNGTPGQTNNGVLSQSQEQAEVVTPETDFDRSNITKEMHIHRDWIAGLIGKKGCNIKAIQTKSNTQINFKDDAFSGDRICLIQGLPPDVSVAEALIQRYIAELPVVIAQSIQVPQSAVGRIIGRGGESIRSIQELSKCKVNVDTNNRYGRGGGDIRMVSVTLKGTEEQIEYARSLITEKVEEEKVLRRNIEATTRFRSTRLPPAPNSPPPSTSDGGSPLASATTNGAYSTPVSVSGLKDRVVEVFVCCAYHPNDFWVQVVGRESIELDKLSDMMTDYYRNSPPEEMAFNVGDIVAAPFDYDGKMYRGRVLRVEEDVVEIAYVDYGDKRIVRQWDVRLLFPEFLTLKFQAMQATLNLNCKDERWTDDAIAAFCDLTYCAQWKSLTAKVLDFLKPSNDTIDVILWLDLFNGDMNIKDQLIFRGLAFPKDQLLDPEQFPASIPTPMDNGTYNNANFLKSYASVAAQDTNNVFTNE